MGSETRNNMAALTTAEHQTAMDKLEAEKAVLSAQVAEQNKKLWALQKACTDLTNNGYLNRDPFYLNSSVTWPEEWTSQQRKEGDERNDLQNEVDNLRSQLDNVASEVVKFTNTLADLQAEEVLKDEAKERRSALTRETEEIDDLINRRKHKIRALQFEIDNPGIERQTMTDSMHDLLMRLDRYESLADIERMIATQQRIINEKKLELTELDNQVALKVKELAERKANPVTNLDSLCGDLQRVQAEFLPDKIHVEEIAEPVLQVSYRPEPACCRMLGLCNGRTDFVTNNSLNWAADGSLCSNTASN